MRGLVARGRDGTRARRGSGARRRVGAALVLAALSACAAVTRPVPPLPDDALAYGREIARAQQEQFLLNIVRLRYNDPVSFVEIDRLTTQDRTAYDGRLSSAVALDGSPITEILSGNLGAQRSHQPTIVYEHLRGRRYADQLLRPLPPESVLLLSQSGWNIEQLMLCCVARIGDVDNARQAAGPRLGEVPDNAAFRELAGLMLAAQRNANLLVQPVEPTPDHEFLRTDEATVILKWWRNTEDGQALASFFRASWASDVKEIGGDRYATEISSRGNLYGDFAFKGRSILGILSALSLSVNVPPEHERLVAGDQGTQRQPDGAGVCAAPAKGAQLLSDYFTVQVAPERPADASVAVQHRGHWYFVPDMCLSAKSTLSLLQQLYAMQAGLSDGRDTLILLGG